MASAGVLGGHLYVYVRNISCSQVGARADSSGISSFFFFPTLAALSVIVPCRAFPLLGSPSWDPAVRGLPPGSWCMGFAGTMSWVARGTLPLGSRSPSCPSPGFPPDAPLGPGLLPLIRSPLGCLCFPSCYGGPRPRGATPASPLRGCAPL